MKLKRLFSFLAAALVLVMNSCVQPQPEYTLPEISVTSAEGGAVTAVNFAAEGGEQSFTITATRSWNISSSADWFAITPMSDNNLEMTSKAVVVTLTAAPNEDGARNETIKISMDKTTVSINVAQAGKGQVALGEVIYFDNFDKKVAEKDGNFWPYMSEEYGNPTPESQSAVAYASQNITVRANSTSNSNYSDYDGSGSNNLFFGKTENYVTISGISLAELEGNAMTITFGTEKYTQDGDSTFKNDEFTLLISGDGAKWSAVSYTFAEGAELAGRWNLATAQFNLKEVPETLSLRFSASVASVYRLDDVKITSGGGGAEIDLSAGGSVSGGTTGGGTTEPDPSAEAITVAEFIEKADPATTYQLTGTISGSINTQYGNFDLVDESGSIYVYGLVDSTGATIDWAAKGLNAGDVITVQGKYFYYEQGSKHEIKNALYISHTDGEGGTTEPEPPVAGEGEYASDSPFIQASDDSANAAYGLGETKIGGQAATGFKLGKSKQEGKFTSKAVGVSGDKYLNFYAVAWGAGGDKTIYFRVNGGEAIAQPIKANEGAAQNPPYNNLTPTADDHYSVKLTGLTESSVIEFSTNAAFDCAATSDYATRAIFFGVKLTDEALGEGGNGGGTTEPEPEPSGITPIADILALGEGATISNATIEGVVISNMGLNNLTSKKGLYVQDATAGLQFYLAANHEFAFGDKVQIDLSGATVGVYNEAIQISGLALEKITKISSDNAVEAKTVSMADFLANKYEGQYVALEGVQVVAADLTKTWVMDGMHTSINMEDANGNNFVVFSSKYATYGAETVAQGSGTIKGIAGYSKGAVQIIFAQATDYAGLTGARFGEQGEGGGTEPEPEPSGVIKATIGEFLNAEESTTQWYELTGKITSIEKADYGNIYIQDDNDSVLIYGLCATKVEKNDKSFSSLGLKVGDTVTLHTLRTSYNGTPQGGGSTNPAYYISHESAPVVEPEIPEGSVVAEAVFANMGYANSESVEGKTISLDENVSIVFLKANASNEPAYYDSGSAIRMYQNGSTLDVTANGKTITSIELTFASNHYYIGADCGELSDEGPVRTWTGSATDVKFTTTGTDKSHRAYVSAIKVTYSK